jgi:hypothetical protein
LGQAAEKKSVAVDNKTGSQFAGQTTKMRVMVKTLIEVGLCSRSMSASAMLESSYRHKAISC